MKYCSEYMTLD